MSCHRSEPSPQTAYQLVIDVPHRLELQVGRLGRVELAAGRYVYTGSARRGLEARIRRHLSAEKRLRWHIDHLLTAPGVHVVEVRRSTLPECELNAGTPGTVPVPGFGASDCRQRCGSHLKRCPDLEGG